MTHRQAVLAMVAAALMWSIAGVVTRQLESARGFEVTFWRSAFNALALVVLLVALRGPAVLARTLRGGRLLWASGVCWGVMFTAFMFALTLTTVANVLVTMAAGPLVTALGARIALGQQLAARTWAAVALAGAGIAWMYRSELAAAGSRQGVGIAVAAAVPLAASANWVLLQHLKGRQEAPDMLGAVLIGALLSAAATLPATLPFAASVHDLSWLALLGVVQLAVPCLLAVAAARVLSAPEVSLLGLLEVFGVLWAWLGAGESPSTAVLAGRSLVVAALAGHAALGLRATASPGRR